jgi:exopolysaccharide biosynthesis polyprenyl glycosylphosphotransferase
MNFDLNGQMSHPIAANKKSAFFINKIIGKIRGFEAPFSERRLLLLTVDGLVVLLLVGAALLLWQQTAGRLFDPAFFQARWYWFPSLLVGWWILAGLNGLYDIPSSSIKFLTALRVTIVAFLGLIIYLIMFFVAPQALPRLFFIYFLLLVPPAIILWRCVYATVFYRPPFFHRILILGHRMQGDIIGRQLQEASGLCCQLLGYVDYDHRPTGSPSEQDGLPIWRRPTDLLALAQRLQAHEIVVSAKERLEDDLFYQLVECQAHGVRVSLMPDFYEKLYHSTPVEHFDSTWALYMIQDRPVFKRQLLLVKRLLDLALALIGLLMLAPMMPLIALAIRLDSPGPIFYRQVRCGRAGRPFSIVKFRTMVPDAERDGKPRWAAKDDVRITRVGRYLRKTRLDELPQLINVLQGEMSIVGPRPERPEFVEDLQLEIPYYRTRLLVKPGLTGWSQINYGYGSTTEDALIKLQYDLYYLRHWSLWLDLYTIFQTIGVVLRLKGT